MTPEQLSTIILTIVGIILQLVFKYAPKVKQWYEVQTNKGPIMLAVVVVTGAAYYGLSCTPYAATLGIGIACTVESAFTLLRAIGIIAIGQQLTYLFTRSSAPKG
jgi:hypothetical protein